MKKLILSLITISITALSVLAQGPAISSFTQIDINTLSIPNSGIVTTCADGGYFMSKKNVLTRYDSSNTVLWSQSFSANTSINSIADDGANGAIVTGGVGGTLGLGNDSLATLYVTAGGYYSDAFVARINSSGKIWWNRFGEINDSLTGYDEGIDVKVLNNKVYWLVQSNGCNVYFNGVYYPLETYGQFKVMLVQFGIDGVVDWVNMSKGGEQDPISMAVNGSDVFYASNSFGITDSIDFGNNVKTITKGSLFVVKFNSAGMAQWVSNYDNYNNSGSFGGFSADDEGNVYVSGLASNFTTTFGIRKAAGYLIKMSGTNGANLWTRVLSVGALKGAIFSGGKIYVGGSISSGTIYLSTNATDSVPITKSVSTLGYECFVATFDKSGSYQGITKSSGGTDFSILQYLQSTSKSVTVMGLYSANMVFGDVTLPAIGGNVSPYFIGFFNIPIGASNGISNVSNNVIQAIYPNPVQNKLMIDVAAGDEVLKVDVTNTQGQLLHQVFDANKPIDLSNLNTGVYFVTVTTKNGTSTQKLIKQ